MKKPDIPYVEIVGEARSAPLTRDQLREANRPHLLSLARFLGKRVAMKRLEGYLDDVEQEAHEARARGHNNPMMRSRNLR